MSYILPDDRVTEIVPGQIWGVGPYRTEIIKSNSRWAWRTWDVIHPNLGGRGTIGKGYTRTKMKAMEDSLELLRKAANIDQIPTGGGGAVES